jgi:type II secretory pathway pseudopilin PulG
MLLFCRERPPRRSDVGISLIALIITIIVVIILAVIIIGVATNTPEKAKLATFISDISEIQQGVETKKATNYMPSADGTFDVNKGFTKITIKKTPYSTTEDGWIVNLDNINIKSSTRGNDYNDVVENSQITFGEGAPDIYVYDSDGVVYYAPGFTDKDNTIYSKVDVTYAATGEIPRVEADNPSYWTFNATTGIISKYTGPEVAELTIPNYINGVKVNGITGDLDNRRGIISNTSISSVIISPGITSIGEMAFDFSTNLKNITIPNTVTLIGDYAFGVCQKLEILIIPSSVINIGKDIVVGCTKLKEINVASNNNTYKSIDGVLFNKAGDTLLIFPNNSIITEYDIPAGVTTIYDSSFSYCSLITEINIPDSVTNIENAAFACCFSLININIPSSVSFIGSDAFTNCLELVTIDISEDNQSYKLVDNVLFNKSGTLLHTYFIKRPGLTYTIPSGVTDIEDGAFNQCVQLTSITLPNTLINIGTGIGNGSFNGCTKITSMTIPSSVVSIGSSAFSYCTKLAQIIIMDKDPDDITGAKWGAPASTVVTWNP